MVTKTLDQQGNVVSDVTGSQYHYKDKQWITKKKNSLSVADIQVGDITLEEDTITADNIITDHISEKTTDHGVTIESVNIKDGAVAATGDVTASGGTVSLATHVGSTSNPHSVTKTQVSLGNVDDVQQMPLSYLDTDGTLAANSDSKVPSQKAVKSYCDGLIAANDAMVYQGVINCPANYPEASCGDTYRIATAGQIGGGPFVEVGDMLICIEDTAGGEGSKWDIIQVNIDGAVTGPASATDNSIAIFDGTTGKIIKGGTNTNTEIANVVTYAAKTNTANSFGAYNQTFNTNTLKIDAANGRVGIGITSPSQMVDIGTGTSIGALTFFSDPGLNDATLSGTYYGIGNWTLRIQIDGTGTPNTFKWSIDGGSTWVATGVAITGSAQALNYTGVSVTFGATTGHTLNNYWQATLTPPNGELNISKGLYIDGLLFATNKGYNSVKVGKDSFNAKDTGGMNTSLGYRNLTKNLTGYNNVAVGAYALYNVTSGYELTTLGTYAYTSMVSGSRAVAIGANAGYSITSGAYGILIGYNAGRYLADGSTPTTSAPYGVYIGAGTKTSADAASNEIAIGYNTIGKGSNTVNIGNTSITKTYLNGVVNIDNLTASKVVLTDTYKNLISGTNTNDEISDAVTKRHDRAHALDSTSDHSIGSLTSGYIVKSDGTKLAPSIMSESGTVLSVAGGLAVDSNTLYVDASNNRVGVNCVPAAGSDFEVSGKSLLWTSGSSDIQYIPLEIQAYKTSGNMLSPFGSGINFSVYDNSSGPYILAQIGAITLADGVEVTKDYGMFGINVASAGTLNTRLTLGSNGAMTLSGYSGSTNKLAYFGSGGLITATSFSISDVALKTATNTFGAYDQTWDTNTMFLDESEDMVGFGTVTPIGRIHAISSDATKTAFFERTSAGSTLRTAMRLMGTASAAMSDDYGPSIDFHIRTTGGAVADAIGRIGVVRGGGDTTGDLVIYTGAAAAATEKVRITSDGKIGVGLTDTTYMLDVLGADVYGLRAVNSAALGSSSGGGIMAASSGTPTAADKRLGSLFMGAVSTGTTYQYGGSINTYSEEAWSATAAGSYMAFYTMPLGAVVRTEKMRITAAGNVGIGCTPSTTFEVAGQGKVTSGTFPPFQVHRTQAAAGATYGGMLVERDSHASYTPVDGTGVAIYFKAPDDAKNSTYTGTISGVMDTVADGSEIGSIRICASYHGTDPSSSTHLVVKAGASQTVAEVQINGGLNVGGTSAAGDNNLLVGGTATITGAFGCNSKTAQTAYASGGAAPAGGTGTTAGAYDTAAHRDALITLVNNIRTALVNNGIMS